MRATHTAGRVFEARGSGANNNSICSKVTRCHRFDPSRSECSVSLVLGICFGRHACVRARHGELLRCIHCTASGWCERNINWARLFIVRSSQPAVISIHCAILIQWSLELQPIQAYICERSWAVTQVHRNTTKLHSIKIHKRTHRKLSKITK